MASPIYELNILRPSKESVESKLNTSGRLKSDQGHEAMSIARKRQHVIESSGGRWAVLSEGSSRASRTFDSKEQAINYGREAAKRERSELYIHNRDGRVGSTATYRSAAHKAKHAK